MTTGLIQHAFTRINQQNSQVTGRCAGRHIARVLLVARRVGNNKFALFGREIAIRYVNGYALLALGL